MNVTTTVGGNMAIQAWLKQALAYTGEWLDYQMRQTEQPGCVIAVAHKGRIVFERAYGHADLATGERMTPRHRFRVASHSKSFTAAGILKLREAGELRLDDPVGQHVDGLHPAVAETTLNQLLSHSAGLVRDGADAGQWQDRRPFADETALRATLAAPPVLDASSRFKYSNHGFGLLGLVIESITGAPYGDWIGREIVAPSKLGETTPDGPAPEGVPVARGHSGKLPLGHRVVVPGDNSTNALASATGFVSTAGDLARYFASLDPAAARSVLSPASRREMVRKQWREPHAVDACHYGLGVTLGTAGGWEWIGHGGGFQSCISRTVSLPGRDLSVSVLTNAVDGAAASWSDGVIHILREFTARGAAGARTRDWTGRWWGLWGVVDLIAHRDHVVVASPGLINAYSGASEIEVTARDQGTIRLGAGFDSHGEPARLVRGRDGRVRDVWLGGTKLVSERRAKAELKRRYG
jgi:CubicO group peptidase (beta-lactamase class C family)